MPEAAVTATRTVAALYVDPMGCYAGLPGVDPWGEERDARGYDTDRDASPRDEGLVLHPPCSTWCQLASVNEKRYGHPIGSDGGCFAAALTSARRWGGVLEHPAYTIAWQRYRLRRPHMPGGWLPTRCGGWVCHVEQGHYGHPARKATWLLVYGLERGELPELQLGAVHQGHRVGGLDRQPRGRRGQAEDRQEGRRRHPASLPGRAPRHGPHREGPVTAPKAKAAPVPAGAALLRARARRTRMLRRVQASGAMRNLTQATPAVHHHYARSSGMLP